MLRAGDTVQSPISNSLVCKEESGEGSELESKFDRGTIALAVSLIAGS